MTIIGIDPGFARVGYGVIQKRGERIIYRSAGIIESANGSSSERVCLMEKELETVIKKEKPFLVGVEKLFFSKNKKTALLVAEARGVIINTLLKKNIRVLELFPSEVKMGVTGSGNASKQSVAFMVSRILGIKTDFLLDDVTDALAIAITAANTRSFGG